MKKRSSLIWGFAVVVVLVVSGDAAYAQRGRDSRGKEVKKEAKTAEEIKEESSVTKHTVRIGGKKIAYTATAGTLLLTEEDSKKKVAVFYVAYTKDGEDPAKRPVMFTLLAEGESPQPRVGLRAFCFRGALKRKRSADSEAVPRFERRQNQPQPER